MDEKDRKTKLKNLILEVDQELEKTGTNEITKRLELARKKAGYQMRLAEDHKLALEYANEFLRLDEELQRRLSIFYN